MKTYLTYQTEDFVQDPYFRKWALGELPPGDRFWETWQSTHPDQYETLERARSMVTALRIPAVETDQMEIRHAIDRVLSATETTGRKPLGRVNLLRIAASIMLVGALAYWLVAWEENALRKPVGAQRNTSGKAAFNEVNSTRAPRTIVLPDGSRITLAGHSSLRLGPHFGEALREVYLTGEAFFDVARDTERPFVVYSGGVVTKVLGTSFRVRAYESDANVSVGVRTGKVTVFKQAPGRQADPMLSEEVVLTPNQQAVFVKKEDKFVKTLVEQPAALNARQAHRQLDFSETPIPVVLNTLEQVYGVKMIYDAEKLKECNMTGSLNEGSLYDKLGIVCETIEAHFKVMDGQVVIDGRGCQ